MTGQLKETIAGGLGRLGIFVEADTVAVEHTDDFSHGDYATSAALQFAKQTGMNPRELAAKLVETLGEIEGFSKIEIAGPGFINFTLDPAFLHRSLEDGRTHAEKWGSGTRLTGTEIMVEYTDPNPFKAFHIGHLMSNAIGESIARLKQFSGARVVRANYQGDVGVQHCLRYLGHEKTRHPS